MWKGRTKRPVDRVHKCQPPWDRVGWREYYRGQPENREEKRGVRALAPNPKGAPAATESPSDTSKDHGGHSAPRNCIIEISSCLPKKYTILCASYTSRKQRKKKLHCTLNAKKDSCLIIYSNNYFTLQK